MEQKKKGRTPFDIKAEREKHPDLSKRNTDDKAFKLAWTVKQKRLKFPAIAMKFTDDDEFLKAVKEETAAKPKAPKAGKNIPNELQAAYERALEKIEEEVKTYRQGLINKLNEKVKNLNL